MRKKLSIEQMDNGYVVRVLHCGLSPFKEPYEDCKPACVFETFEALISNLEGFLKLPEKEK